MKSTIPALLIAFIFSVVEAKAQQTHYIYIQTNDKQPFYVKLNQKVYSSSASGYLILSKLVDSTYNLSIGFPKNEWAQQNFNCVIDKKDVGYLLKDFGDKGWGLFNLQTLDVTMSGNAAANKNIVKEERTDSFSNMLSAVVNDPGIKEKRIVKPEVKQDTIHPVQTTETVVAEEPAKTEATNIVATIDNKVIRSTIKKILQHSNADGIELIYLDNNNGTQDTIRIFIPVDKTTTIKQDNKVQEPVEATVKPEENKAIVVEAPPKPVIDTTPKVSGQTVAETKKEIIVPPAKPAESIVSVENRITNSTCKNSASAEDFLKLRKKMAGEATDDNMINAAKKVFKAKCFTTAQLQNLSYLFLKDDGKYRFFDTAYPFVSDPQNFSSLQSELKDGYYIDRFKAMIHH
jgi:hypothetical protein